MFTARPDAFDERELTEAVSLCTPGGALNRAAVGWARRPVHRCNLSGHWLRKKRWNYWCITTDRFLFSATISNIDYAGVAFVYWYDRDTHRFVEQTVQTPFGRGCRMPDTVGAPVTFQHDRLTVVLDMGETGGRLRVDSPAFGGAPLAAEFAVTYPAGHETLNVVIPWADARFQFTGKHNCLPAGGQVQWGDDGYDFPQGRSYACLDYGRGVWPYRCAWNWGAASGRVAGRTVGLNLGGKWTDGTGMTENAVCVDGRITKIGEDLRWEYDPGDFMRPWRIVTPVSDRVALTFTPEHERVAAADLLLIRSEVHQVFGTFAGSIETADGARVEVRDLFGWAEEHRARW